MAKAKKEKASQKSALKKQATVSRPNAKQGKGLALKAPENLAKGSLSSRSSMKTGVVSSKKVLNTKPIPNPRAPVPKTKAPVSHTKASASPTKAMERAELQAVLARKAGVSLGKKGKPDGIASAPAKTQTPASPTKLSENPTNKDLKAEKAIKVAKAAEFASKKQKGAAQKALEAQEDLSNAGKKWLGLYNQLRNTRTKPYDMSASYDVKSGIQHKTLGWGYVVETRGDRMDVLFKDGMKTLVINYVRT